MGHRYLEKMKSEIIRSSKEFKDLIKQIQISQIKQGRKPYSTIKITSLISKEMQKGVLDYEKFIKL